MKNIFFSIFLLLGLVGCGGDQNNTADNMFPTHAIAGARQSAPQKNSAPTFGLRANYTITKTSAGYTVTDFVGATGTQTVSLSATQIVFSDMTVNLGIGDKSKTISAANLQSLIELYIAYFNRVPDADGLSYWIDQLVSGQSLDQIGTAFYNAAIYYSSLTGYSASMTNAEFITVIYKNVLGRSSVDSGGMTYWSNGLANGSETRGTLVGSILASAHTFKGDATYGYVADLLDNKVEFANFFTIQLGLNYNTPEDSIKNTMAMVAAITPKSTAAAFSLLKINPAATNTTDFGKSAYTFSNETPSYALDTKNISYPTSFTVTATSSQVNTDPCNLDITTVTYPKSYLGTFPLPQVQGAPFETNVVRGVALVDWWGKTNPTWTNGCIGDVRNEFTKTIARLKSIGAEWIVVVPWTNIRERTDGSWYMVPQTEVSSILDEDLEFIVKTAHEVGIKVHWRNQLQAIETSKGVFPPEGSEINVKKFIPAYKAYMADRASLFQRIGVDSMDIDCSFCWTYQMSQANWDSLWLPTLAEVAATTKKTYNGKTSIFGNSYNDKYTDLLKNIDTVNIHLGVPQFSQEELSKLSVSSYRSKLASFRSLVNTIDSLGKNVSFLFGVQPFKRHLIDMSYLEATQCTDISNWGVGSECIQRTIDPDFSVQAIAYEAILEEINSYKLVNKKYVFAGDYLLTNSLLPADAFPNLHSSPRNKPAEGILKKWYEK